MRVQLHPADEGGCGQYRMFWPGQEVAEQGLARVEIRFPGDLELDIELDAEGHITVVDAAPVEADVLVLQRPTSDVIAQAIPFVQSYGTAVVVEIDDDIDTIHPKHQMHHARESAKYLWKACAAADLVVCTTPRLAEKYGRTTPARVVPNFLPDSFLDIIPANDFGGPIGWTGSTASHPNDLPAARDGVRQNTDHLFVLGNERGVEEQIGVPVTATGWVPIERYPQMMAEIAVGIVPLADTPFNDAKSWLKGLEFAGAGVPFVASATGPYRALRDEGIGRVARKPVDWVKHLRQLRTDQAMWAEEAARQREIALGSFMIRQNAHLWVEAWQEAMSRACSSV